MTYPQESSDLPAFSMLVHLEDSMLILELQTLALDRLSWVRTFQNEDEENDFALCFVLETLSCLLRATIPLSAFTLRCAYRQTVLVMQQNEKDNHATYPW